jgi:hypothetical protein
MCGYIEFDVACKKNIKKILSDALCGGGGSVNLDQFSVRSVTGPLDADEDDNPTFGEIVDEGVLIDGPTKNTEGLSIDYLFKFDTSDEERKRIKYHIASIGDKVIGMGGPAATQYSYAVGPSNGYPYYIKALIGTSTLATGAMVFRTALLKKKAYTKYFGAIDGASESEIPPGGIGCGNPKEFNYSYYTILVKEKHKDRILDTFMDDAPFFESLTIHNKNNDDCLGALEKQYFKDDSSCYDISGAEKQVTVSRDTAEKIALRCPFQISYIPEDKKLEVCRYIFTVPGDSSKFSWTGLLADNKAHYLLFPTNWIRPNEFTPLNPKGKSIKIVFHLILTPYSFY